MNIPLRYFTVAESKEAFGVRACAVIQREADLAHRLAGRLTSVTGWY